MLNHVVDDLRRVSELLRFTDTRSTVCVWINKTYNVVQEILPAKQLSLLCQKSKLIVLVSWEIKKDRTIWFIKKKEKISCSEYIFISFYSPVCRSACFMWMWVCVCIWCVLLKYDDVNDDDPTLFAADDIKSATLYVRMYGHTDTSHYLLCLWCLVKLWPLLRPAG